MVTAAVKAWAAANNVTKSNAAAVTAAAKSGGDWRAATVSPSSSGSLSTPLLSASGRPISASVQARNTQTAANIAASGLQGTSTSGLSGNKYTAPVSQSQNNNIFGDRGINSTRDIFKGTGIKTSTGDIVTDFSKPLDMPKELDVYGEAAKQREKLNPGTLANRNDTIAYNLKASGVDTIQGITDYLSKQGGFGAATQEEQQNTIKSIAARIGVGEQPTVTIADQLEADKMTMFADYKIERDKLVAEGANQDVVKRMDNILGQEIRPLNDSEIQQIVNETGLKPEEVKATADERAKARQRMADPFQQKEQDLETEKQRNIDDAKLQLERTTQTINDNISDVVTQMERNTTGAEKVGALKGYVASSGYMAGINNIKTDAMDIVTRLNRQLDNASTDTAKYVNRTNTDFTTNMEIVHKSFTDGILELRLAGTNEVNTLLTKYSPSDKLMKTELDRLSSEYNIRSQDLISKLQTNYKAATDNAYLEVEKIQTFQTKQAQLQDIIMSQLFQNNGQALRGMSDAAIQNLADQGYIGQDQVPVLKSAREGAIQDFKLNEQYKQSQTNVNNYKAGNAAQNTGDVASSAMSVPDGQYGGECVEFVNDVLENNGFPAFSHDADQSIANKISKKNSDTPAFGSVLIRQTNTPDGQKYGDAVIVTGINGDTISFKGSNNDGNGYTYSGQISAKDASIKGYYDPKKAQMQAQLEGSVGDLFTATGLSNDAIKYAQQGQTALTRMPIAQQKIVKKERENYAKAKGLDTSTFMAKYNALTDSLERSTKIPFNIQRDELEISGTIENLMKTADANKFGAMKRANLVKMFAGEEFNDNNVVEYEFQLGLLQEEVAGYYSALRGDTAPTEADSKKAANTIVAGISSGGLKGLQSGLEKSVLKLGENLPKQSEVINKQVRTLFGVGDKYKGTATEKKAETPANNQGAGRWNKNQ